NRTWVPETLQWGTYSKLYVAPVDITHVLDETLWDKVNERQYKVKDDIAELGLEFHERIVKAFRDDPKHHFQVVDDWKTLGAGGVVLEVALVQLVPNKAGLGLLGLAAWAAPLEVGVPVGTVTAFVDHGSVAFELRARDAQSGDVVAMAADREVGAM